jgi:hypothetical protein
MEGGALSKIIPKGPFSISAVNQKVIGSNPVWGAKYFPLRNSLRLLVNSAAAFTGRNGPYCPKAGRYHRRRTSAAELPTPARRRHFNVKLSDSPPSGERLVNAPGATILARACGLAARTLEPRGVHGDVRGG